MTSKQYWFPVRPARNGWGWGLPVCWQGWVVFAIFFAALFGGPFVLEPYGQLVMAAYIVSIASVFLGVVFWKGEPQSMRDTRNHAP